MDRRTIYSDVDDTLLLHNKSEYPEEKWITVECNGRKFVGVPHDLNIKLLVKFYKLGYDVYVWSKTGKSWAEAVTNALGLNDIVTACLSKPDYIMDDKGVEGWIGPRIWRDPKTGVEV